MKHRSSRWQDLYHRTGQVEAEWFNGGIVRLGQEHGVPTPYSSLLHELHHERAARQQGPGRLAVRELRALSSPKNLRPLF